MSRGGEETRAAVLEAALDLASAEGLGGVTLGVLADRVGMSKSGLFAHFASKEALQIAILEAAIARFSTRVIAPALRAPRGEPRVRALFDRWLAWAGELPGGCVFVVASVELDDKPGPVRDVLAASQRDWLAVWTTAARLAVEQGHFRPDLDVERFGHAIYCLGLGHHVASRLLAGPVGAHTHETFEELVRGARRAAR